MNKKLYKTKNGAMISGVLKGISEYVEVDVTVVRVIFVVLALVTTGFPFVLLYFIPVSYTHLQCVNIIYLNQITLIKV